MITRFYYSLTQHAGIPLVITKNEFGISMPKNVTNFDPNYPVTNAQGIIWLVTNLAPNLTTSIIGNDTAITKELMKHVWANLYNKEVGYVDVEHNPWEHVTKPYDGDDWEQMCQEFGMNVYSLYIDTKDYYEAVIALYEAEKTHLMDAIVSGSTVTNNGDVRFNDTPQNTPTVEGYAEDNYSTNVTKSNSTITTTANTELLTKMARLDEVQRLLRNLYADWAFEFNKLIVGE